MIRSITRTPAPFRRKFTTLNAFGTCRCGLHESYASIPVINTGRLKNDDEEDRPSILQVQQHCDFLKQQRSYRLLCHLRKGGMVIRHETEAIVLNVRRWNNVTIASLVAARPTWCGSDYNMTSRNRFATQCANYSSSSNSDKSLSSTLSNRNLGTTRVPTPESSLPSEPSAFEKLKATWAKGVLRQGMDLSIYVFKTVISYLLKLPGNIMYYATHPDELRQSLTRLKKTAQDEINHYWVGFKLFWAEIRTARTLLGQTLRGSTLTRRERKQLLRTITDLFRMVPFTMFIIIPFMEFALPFALKLFPNMLPSTFQDSLKAEVGMKRELQSRIAMAQFFQETLEELAKEQKRKASKRKMELADAGLTPEEASDVVIEQEDTAVSMLEFLAKARNGEMVPPDVIIRYATYFQDDLTLDNMPRMQLINMCKYMSIPPYGSDAFLRFQLRHTIRGLKEDDQRILWEGIDSLTKMELREACQERGMRSTGLSKDAYKQSLQQWLDLSVHKNVPISLLIMSRIFFLRDEMFESKADEEVKSKSLSGLVDAMSGIDKEVLDHVILEVATSEEKQSDPDIRKLKLEVVSKQNELIKQEEADRKAKAKRKEAEKVDKALAVESPSISTSITTAEPAIVTEIPVVKLPQSEATETKVESEPSELRERDLSTEEMEAISQLVSHDPVSKERAELQRIKAAIRPEGKTSTAPGTDDTMDYGIPATEVPLPILSTPSDIGGSLSSSSSEMESSEVRIESFIPKEPVEIQHDSSEEDKIIARLKKSVSSMVDKIEVQMSEVEVKIGDKLHYLDKDRDGVLSREEMADVLQLVLKRKVNFEEAMEIASAMDENQDGAFTVQEMIRWMDKHKLVKFVEEGRDADMDRIMESHSSELQRDDDSSAVKP